MDIDTNTKSINTNEWTFLIIHIRASPSAAVQQDKQKHETTLRAHVRVDVRSLVLLLFNSYPVDSFTVSQEVNYH